MTFKHSLRIGIVGAGPAGLATAIAFAKQGHQVDLYEKHAQLATLGAGVLIQPRGLDALDELGVRAAFDAVSVPIRRLAAKSHKGWGLVEIDYQDQCARGVSRPALSGVLYAAALDAGARIHFESAVQAVEVRAGKAHVTMLRGEEVFDLLVLADGAASLLREQVGLAERSTLYAWGALHGKFWVDEWAANDVLQQRCRGTSEMMGLMPTQFNQGRTLVSLYWSIPLKNYAAWRASDLETWKEHLLKLWPQARCVLDQIKRHEDLELGSYRHTWPKNLALPPCCVVGDAAHAMSPQLGLGTTLAVQDALAVAAAVDELGSVEGLRAYSNRRLRISQGYQTVSRILTPCFQAQGNGLLRDLFFVLGRRIPGVQWAMKRSLSIGGGKPRKIPLENSLG